MSAPVNELIAAARELIVLAHRRAEDLINAASAEPSDPAADVMRQQAADWRVKAEAAAKAISRIVP